VLLILRSAEAMLAVMAPFARAELEQIGRKMVCNEYSGASLT